MMVTMTTAHLRVEGEVLLAEDEAHDALLPVAGRELVAELGAAGVPHEHLQHGSSRQASRRQATAAGWRHRESRRGRRCVSPVVRAACMPMPVPPPSSP